MRAVASGFSIAASILHYSICRPSKHPPIRSTAESNRCLPAAIPQPGFPRLQLVSPRQLEHYHASCRISSTDLIISESSGVCRSPSSLIKSSARMGRSGYDISGFGAAFLVRRPEGEVRVEEQKAVEEVVGGSGKGKGKGKQTRMWGAVS